MASRTATVEVIRVGTVLHGYCGGMFWDSHDCKRVEAIGADWVVARELGRGAEPLFVWTAPEKLLEHANEPCEICDG